MAEFIEVPIAREDGSDGLNYINVNTISHIDFRTGQAGEGSTLTVHLTDGYWFTLSGPNADKMMTLLRNHVNNGLNGDASEN